MTSKYYTLVASLIRRGINRWLLIPVETNLSYRQLLGHRSEIIRKLSLYLPDRIWSEINNRFASHIYLQKGGFMEKTGCRNSFNCISHKKRDFPGSCHQESDGISTFQFYLDRYSEREVNHVI
ncbi:MAG: hypothetical protein ACYTE8_10460 [Planctomycetota bacterium]